MPFGSILAGLVSRDWISVRLSTGVLGGGGSAASLALTCSANRVTSCSAATPCACASAVTAGATSRAGGWVVKGGLSPPSPPADTAGWVGVTFPARLTNSA